MKKLNHNWRNQKPLSVELADKKEENGAIPAKATTRRRLGRFALVGRPAVAVKKVEPTNRIACGASAHGTSPNSETEDGKLPMSFISSGSWRVDEDLLAEMDKVEAAMGRPWSDLAAPKDVGQSEMSSHHHVLTAASTSSSHGACHSITENDHLSVKAKCANNSYTNIKNKRKSVKDNFQHVFETTSFKKLDIVQNIVANNTNEQLMKVTSPTSSPVVKRPKIKLRTPVAQSKRSQKTTTTAAFQPADSSFTTPKGACRRKNSKSSLKTSRDVENNISFSPLLETPIISSDSSDEDRDPVIKCKAKSAGEKRNNERRSNRVKVPLNMVETPKRSSTRKRHSPKNLMSPDVKISKFGPSSNKSKSQAANNCDSTSNENSEIQTAQGTENKISKKISSAVSTKKSSPRNGLPLNSNSDETPRKVYKNRTTLGMEPQQQESMVAVNQSRYSNIDSSIPVSASSSTTMSAGPSPVSKTNTSVNLSLTEDKRLLKSWGLPDPVLTAYGKQGVTTMFEWQAECLLSPLVLDGGNLIYSAPTSAGKTLVAEILVLKRVLETRKKALIILPFVSVAREKMFTLQRLYQDAGIRVGGYMGSHSPAGGLSALDVAVCTIEKGNGLVNRMMEDGRIQDIGVVVVDELHMVGDSHRGYLLELMLTKLEFLSLRRESDQRLQIIGMSATLPNLEVLAKWLRAALYRTQFRPVPLSEHIKVDNKIYDSKLEPQGEVPARYISPDDTDHIIALCLETVYDSHSVLVFCPTKNWCEKLCETIARKFYQITHSQKAAEEDIASRENQNESIKKLLLNKSGLRECLEQLKRSPAGVDAMLGRCLINGVGYHHAGLTFDERDIIEGAFREGHLRVLVATSTLSSGVNLPARRVIIRTPMFHGKVIDVLTFKQMSGRAGRKGVDTEGESILICKPSEKMKGRSLLQSDLPAVESCLYFDADSGLSRSLKRAILEVVVSGVTSCPRDVMSYIKCTLLSASMDSNDHGNDSTTEPDEAGPCTASLIDSCITFLQDNEFVSMQTVMNEDGTESMKFFPTQLGSAILASSLSPDEGLLVFAELQKARRSFVLESELHVIYLVTPVYTTDVATTIDWYQFYTLWENLSPAERRVADLVGVRESFIAQAIGGRIHKKTEAQRKAVGVHHRFYTALVLNTLVREVPLMEVAAKFNLNKGQLQSLQQSAATYTGMLTVFCQRLGWHNLELILSRFQRRLSLGVQHELVDLVRISALTASSARMLYNAGYHTVTDVARAEAVQVEELFKTAVPFQSDKKQEGETDWERKERQKTKCIWLTGRKGMTELDAAKEIIQEAKGIVQGDLGVKDIAWNSKVCETTMTSSSSDEEEEEEGSGKNVDEKQEDENDNGVNINDNVNESDKENRTVIDDDQRRSKGNSNLDSVRSGLHEDMTQSKHNEAVSSLDTDTPRFTRVKNRSASKEKCSTGKKGKSTGMSYGVRNVLKGSSVGNEMCQQEEQERCQNHNESNNDLYQSFDDRNCDGESSLRKSGSVSKQNIRGKRRKSRSFVNQSKGSETSFFGQVVVTPPPGLRPFVNDGNKSKVCIDNGIDIGSRDSRTHNVMVDRNKMLEQLSQVEREVNDGVHGSIDATRQNPVCSNKLDKAVLPIQEVEKDKRPNDSDLNKQQRVPATTSQQVEDENDFTDTDKLNRGKLHNTNSIKSTFASHNTKKNKSDFVKEKYKDSSLPGSSDVTEARRDFIEQLDSIEDKDEIICDSKDCSSVSANLSFGENKNCSAVSENISFSQSKNCSSLSDNVSFGESFILDTQTDALLVNAGWDGDSGRSRRTPVAKTMKAGVHKMDASSIGNGSNVSQKPSCSYATRSKSKLSSQPFHRFDMVKNGQCSETRENDVRSEKDLTEPTEKAGTAEHLDSNNTSLDQSMESVSILEAGTKNKMKKLNVNVESPLCARVDTSSMSSSFLESPISQSHVDKEDDDNNNNDDDDGYDDIDDEPDSLLVASCYERVSNFDEGMLECSGYDDLDLGVNNSLSELNVVRNTPRISVTKQTTSKARFGQRQIPGNKLQSNVDSNNYPNANADENALLTSTDWDAVRCYNPNTPNPISDTQFTDDSLLAAVDLGGMTPLSSLNNCSKSNTNQRQNNNTEKNKTLIKSTENRPAHTNRSSQRSNVNDPCMEEEPGPSDKNTFFSDSLSASLVDQVFAQCEENNSSSVIKTSSPYNINCPPRQSQRRQNNAITHHLPHHPHSSLTTTPTSKRTTYSSRKNIPVKQLDISPVLCDSPNNPASHNASPNHPASHNTSPNHPASHIASPNHPASHKNSPISANNSSCHNGSDCVPPTPPDESTTTSHASPYKLAFLSPMASRKKMGGPSTSSTSNIDRQTEESGLRKAVRNVCKDLPLESGGKALSKHKQAQKSNNTRKENITEISMCDSEVGQDLASYDMNLNCSSALEIESHNLNAPIGNDDDDDDNDSDLNIGENPASDLEDDRPKITSQSQLLTQQSFTIIDVCAHQELFQTFLREWRDKPSFSLALACEKTPPVGKGRSPTGIGSRFNKRKSGRQSTKPEPIPSGISIPNSTSQLVGVAVTWENRDAYYISLMPDSDGEQDSDLDDSLAEPPLSETISLQDRIQAIETYLHTHTGCEPPTIQMYDTKTTYTTLAKTLGVRIAKCEDPRVADWLKEPGGRLKNLHRMVTTYLPGELALLDEVGGGSSYQSLGFDVKSHVSGRIRACTESIVTRKLMVEYGHMLQEQELWQAFERTEMPALVTLSRMELNGFGVSLTELECQKSLMTAKLESIEQTAYKMAGHVFSLTSLDDIAKILYLELKLPLNGDPNAVPHLPTRGMRHRRTTVGGTSKEILEKLTKFHPLPALILEWRRISSALTKSLFALQRSAQPCQRLDMMRVFGDCQVFSATGRVSMAEPNIQNIPKDFCVDMKDVFVGSSSSLCGVQDLSQSVSMRRMFVPFTGGVILSADYSQLELRIIAHLSRDSRLGRILNKEGGDVFKMIAAQFKSLDVEEVTANDRQQAKQVCYGMLYGIGPKALGEQIGVDENEASVFMETFKATYPGVRKYLRETVEFCQKNGYVKTLFNRRRYLPSIKHTNPHARAQAERQAVNTSVQGSAADLVKKAMTNIDLKLMQMFPDTRTSHSQSGMKGGSVTTPQSSTNRPQGGFFLLQLHDELIYEVSSRQLHAVARVVRREMERACTLCVPMPVKVNVGPSWGQLKEYDFGGN